MKPQHPLGKTKKEKKPKKAKGSCKKLEKMIDCIDGFIEDAKEQGYSPELIATLEKVKADLEAMKPEPEGDDEEE